MSAEFDHKSYCRRLTRSPGVYRMFDAEDTVLYVGKASNLQNRVRSYFSNRSLGPRIQTMVAQIQRIEVTVTRTESEALLLESQLIKSLKPRYNVVFRDNKSYPYIHLTSHQEFPRIGFYRGACNTEGEFFGPYPSAHAVRDSINQLQKVFRLRNCSDSIFRHRTRPCLQHQINRCSAPCVELISEQDYRRDVDLTRLFLGGQAESVIQSLAEEMEQASEKLEFEQAAITRDRIVNLRRITAQHHISSAKGDMDIIAAECSDNAVSVQLMMLRQGRSLGDRSFFPRQGGKADPDEVLSAFLMHYYGRTTAPAEIIISHPVSDRETMEQVFTEQAGRRVRILYRPRGDKARWLKIVRQNAKLSLQQRLSGKRQHRERMDSLVEILGLDGVPERMECFDISHTQGESTVASCVVFDDNGPVPAEYRRFNITGITPGDDYAAMRQVLERRFRNAHEAESKIPDILFIDGGKGQLAQAIDVVSEYQIENMLMVGVAKGEGRKPGLETLFIGTSMQRVETDASANGFQVIQWIRDESHRFAITGHRRQRGKARNRSALEDIPGIGPKRRKALLTRFGGIRGLQDAGVEELAGIDGISASLARKIYDMLH